MENEATIYHYGVKGMKWGVRRYQNKDGSLTTAGKKRISTQYRKATDRVVKDLNKRGTHMYVKSYNKAADYMNREGIEKFNSQQKKKYGKNFSRREGYASDYEKTFEKVFAKYYNQTLDDFYKTNKNYQRAKELVDKYGMTSWDDLAKSNEAIIDDLRKEVSKYGR